MGLQYNPQKGKGLKRMKLIFLFMLLGFASMKTRSGEGKEPNRPLKRGAQTGKGTKTDWAFCTKEEPCGAQGGDCDSNAESDAYTPANAVVDGGNDSDDPRPNYWLLPSGVKGNPNGKITYTFSGEVKINGFYVRNLGGDRESGTQDFTIYAGDEIVHEGELPEPNGDQQLFRFPLEA